MSAGRVQIHSTRMVSSDFGFETIGHSWERSCLTGFLVALPNMR